MLYLTPLIYVQNRETIDELLDHTSHMVGQQTSQLKDLTAHHTSRATASVKSYAGEYSSKAQNYMGNKSPGSVNGTASSNSATGMSSSTSEEHTLKPSAVAGTADPQSLPTPPGGAPPSSMPSVPQTEFKQESPMSTTA